MFIYIYMFLCIYIYIYIHKCFRPCILVSLDQRRIWDPIKNL